MLKYKKILLDILLNVIATAIPLVVLQLIILPLVALRMDEEAYGLILTVISIVTIVSGSFGNALNNIRLITNSEYEELGATGDFNILLFFETLVGMILIFISVFRMDINAGNIIRIIIMSLLWLLREYYIVIFRIRLNFMGIVINNLVMIVGYLTGFVLFWYTGVWELIYIVGLAASMLYTITRKGCMERSLKRSILFKNTTKELLFLLIAALVNSLLNYADRIIIYPLIGGAAVSIYYASTLFGKMVSTAITPLNSVMLSYLAKQDRLQKSLLKGVLLLSTVSACIGYLICRIIAYPALRLIYPKWADESIKYVPVTTLIAMLTMLISVISPFIMKFCKMKWQLIINVITLAIYLASSIALFKSYGLMGFCFGVLISNVVKLLIMLVLGFRAGNKGEGVKEA